MMNRPTSAFLIGKRCPLSSRYLYQSSLEKDRILQQPSGAVSSRGISHRSTAPISATRSAFSSHHQVVVNYRQQHRYQERHTFSSLASRILPNGSTISYQQYYYCQQQQPQRQNSNTSLRHLSSSSSRSNKYKKKIPKGQKDPFKVLKVQRKTPYAQVKRIFLQIAMQHHPDTGRDKSEEDQNVSREIFIAARQAFEMLVEDPETSGICLRIELDDYVPDEQHADMDAWFKEQTGHDMPFMDEETMKEVAKMTESVGGGGMDRGLDRDGGMWDLARMVTRAVKSGGDGKNLLKLEAGDIKDTVTNANLRARRRRR